MKKKLIALSVLVASVASTSSMAVTTNGQLTFNWQGVVPVSPVTQTTWAFVDGLDMPFTPGTEQLNIVVDSGTKNITAVAVQPYDFFIVPITGNASAGTAVTRNPNATLNTINAYLGSEPVSGGFVGNKQLALATAATATNGQVAITLNGTPLRVGSTNGISVTSANNEAHVSIQLNARAVAADVDEGAALSFTAPVIFSVDLT